MTSNKIGVVGRPRKERPATPGNILADLERDLAASLANKMHPPAMRRRWRDRAHHSYLQLAMIRPEGALEALQWFLAMARAHTLMEHKPIAEHAVLASLGSRLRTVDRNACFHVLKHEPMLRANVADEAKGALDELLSTFPPEYASDFADAVRRGVTSLAPLPEIVVPERVLHGVAEALATDHVSARVQLARADKAKRNAGKPGKKKAPKRTRAAGDWSAAVANGKRRSSAAAVMTFASAINQAVRIQNAVSPTDQTDE